MIEYRHNVRYRIMTTKGFRHFQGMRRTTKKEVLSICLEGNRKLKCSIDHVFFISGVETLAKTLKVGDSLTENNRITSLTLEQYDEYLYDPVGVEDGSEFLSDEGISSHNCDFSTSGDTVIAPDVLNFYQENTVQDPIERTGPNHAYWIWNYPDPVKTYMILADVARGDGKDYSTFHVLDTETMDQVAEYKDQISTKDFARMLVSKAIEWNNATVIVENASIGWDVVTTIQEMNYPNLYYSPKSEIVGTQIDLYVSKFDRGDGMVPGFSMNQKTRPLVIEKARSYIEERSALIRSQRLLDEWRVFVWKHGKSQALQGYNDDLVIPYSIGLFLRDTALRFRQVAIDLTYASLNNYTRTQQDFQVYTPANNNYRQNPWSMEVNGRQDDITWLIG